MTMFTRSRRAAAALAFLVFWVAGVSADGQSLKTPAEDANYTRYSQHEDIARFLSVLAARAKEVKVQVVGRTQEVKGFPAKDLFLAIISEEGAATPEALNRAKLTLMLTAAQHGNEQSAKEAALWLLRDLAVGELKPLLKILNVLIMPQTNPYGNWADVRENEIGLDMNRDHVKLEAEGVRAIHRVFRAFRPEASLDVHEKGDHYYRVSIGCVSNINISPALLDFSRARILPEVQANLSGRSITFFEYLVTEDLGVDTSAGARTPTPGTAGSAPREEMKRYSTTDLNDGRNSLGIYETLSFIQEGSSRHDIETLRERTRWQYFGIRFFTEALAKNAVDVVSLVRTLRRTLSEKARAVSDQNRVHLRMEYVRDPRTPVLHLKKIETAVLAVRPLGVLKKDMKSGDVLTSANVTPVRAREQARVADDVVKKWFPNVESRLTVTRPLGYIIPANRQDVVETLLLHGIEVGLVTGDRPAEVEISAITDIVPAKADYLAPEKIEVEKRTLQTVVKKGDFYVAGAQDAANLIPVLLEPQSDYGFIRYWKYGLVSAKGDIFAFFRLVKPQDLPLVPYRPWVR
jgi:hypothetical protein